MLFALGALLNVILFIKVPSLLRNFSKRDLFLFFLSIEAISTTGLALAVGALWSAIFAVLFFATLPVLYLLLDFFLEEISLNHKTGEIRGIYLTCINAAIAVGPLIVAKFADKNLQSIYLLALVLLVPVFLSFLFFPKPIRKHTKHHDALHLPILNWLRRPDIRRVTTVRFVLQFFYALMVIFTPLYLHEVIQFSWSEIGLIFTIMLLPFVIFEWPMGELGDRYWGEKEIMTLGLFIMGISLIIMPFLGKSFMAWATILFLSRVGASWVEVSAESYFFKKISGDDVGLISIFKLATPVSIIAGAFLGSVLLAFLPFNLIFFFLALVVLLGMKESLFIHDTL